MDGEDLRPFPGRGRSVPILDGKLPISWAEGLIYQPLASSEELFLCKKRKGSVAVGEGDGHPRARSQSIEGDATNAALSLLRARESQQRKRRKSQELHLQNNCVVSASVDPSALAGGCFLQDKDLEKKRKRAASYAVGVEVDKLVSAELWDSWAALSSYEEIHLSTEFAELSFSLGKKYFMTQILENKEGRSVFMNFLKKQHCAENLMFWLDVERYKKIEDKEQRVTRSKLIYDKYIKVDSSCEINISHEVKDVLEEELAKPCIGSNCFERAQKAIFLLMLHGVFEYFLKGEQYEYLKQTAEELENEAGEDNKKGKGKARRARRRNRNDKENCVVS